MVIKISSGSREFSSLLMRQTPLDSGIWNGIKFVINEYVDKCDWWIVCHANGLLENENVVCDPKHLVFVSMEPPAWGRPKDFYKQFSHIVACDRKIEHPNVIYKNGLTWWVGLKVIFKDGHLFSTKFNHNYDSLKKLTAPEKQNKISVITSNNRFFPGHKKRLEFIEKLKNHEISNFIDFYGGYHNPIEDKFDALIGYKYHLALENSVIPDYWTEKLADPLLAWCKTIYYGCPNINDYFSSSSIIRIDIDDFEGSVKLMMQILNTNDYEESLDAIKDARSLVLNNYNLFQLITDICNQPASFLETVSLTPYSFFHERNRRFHLRLLHKLKSMIRKFIHIFCN